MHPDKGTGAGAAAPGPSSSFPGCGRSGRIHGWRSVVRSGVRMPGPGLQAGDICRCTRWLPQKMWRAHQRFSAHPIQQGWFCWAHRQRSDRPIFPVERRALSPAGQTPYPEQGASCWWQAAAGCVPATPVHIPAAKPAAASRATNILRPARLFTVNDIPCASFSFTSICSACCSMKMGTSQNLFFEKRRGTVSIELLDNTPKVWYYNQAVRTANICEGGGTGRRARLRCVWVTMGVQIPSLAPEKDRLSKDRRSFCI